MNQPFLTRAGWLLAGFLLAWHHNGHAQTIPADSVEQRLLRLEHRLDTLTNMVRDTRQQLRQQTRRTTENSLNSRFILRGVFPDSYLMFGGYVQADFIYSFRPLGLATRLRPSAIPVGTGGPPSVTFTPQSSRLYVRSLALIRQRYVFKTWLEFDLFNADLSNRPRLRHAWAEVGPVGAGYTWTLFMDPNAFPNIVEFNSPNALVQLKQMQVRYTFKPRPNLLAGVSLENPGSELRFADSTRHNAAWPLYPDLVAALRLGSEQRRYLRLAGLLHPLTYYNQPADDLHTRLGWGLNLTGNLEITHKETVTFELAYGQGMARYVTELAGAGYDALLPVAGQLRPRPVLAWYAFYDHQWSEHFNSSVGWGYVRLSPEAAEPTTAFHSSDYAIANLLYVPFSFFKAGIEYQYGAQRLLNDQHARGSRLQLTMQSNF